METEKQIDRLFEYLEVHKGIGTKRMFLREILALLQAAKEDDLVWLEDFIHLRKGKYFTKE